MAEIINPSATHSDKHDLSTVVTLLQELKIVQCGLRHEEVTGTRIVGADATGEMPVLGYDRLGLCPLPFRKQIMGCAHTSSNHLLIRHLQAARHQYPQFGVWAEAMDQLFTQIYLLDVRKSELEKEIYASRAGDLTTLNLAKTEILKEHARCITQLRQLREEMLTFLSPSPK